MGHQLHRPDLIADGQAVNGIVFPGVVQVPQARGHHVLCLIENVEILNFSGVGFHGVVKKLGFHPAGIHGHHPDAGALQLPDHGPGVAEDEGLGSTVGGDVGHRLEGGQAVQLEDVAGLPHIGDAQPGHDHQGFAVQVDHPAVVGNGYLVVSAEFAESGGIHQQFDAGFLCFQHGLQGFKTFFFQQVKRYGTNGDGGFFLQFLQRIGPAGNGPDFIHLDPSR